MLRKMLADVFPSQEILVCKASVLHQSLCSNTLEPYAVPRAIFQLNKLYFSILRDDKASLERRIAATSSEAERIEANLLLSVIHAALSARLVEHLEMDALSACKLPESQHLRDFSKFLSERAAYTKEVKQYLVDLKADIASTNWRTVENISMPTAKIYSLDSDDDASEEESADEDNYFAYGSAHYQRTGQHGWRWAHTMPLWAKRMDIELEEIDLQHVDTPNDLLGVYDKIIGHLRHASKERMHPKVAEFHRHHLGEIEALKFIPSIPKQYSNSMRSLGSIE